MAENKPKALHDTLPPAFELFAQEAHQLEHAYAELKKEYQAMKAAWEKSQQALQTQLVESHDMAFYLNHLINHISQGLLCIDFTGVITSYNPAAEAILGIPQEKVLYQNFWSQWDDNLLGFSMREALVKQCPQGATLTTLELSDGTRREMEVEYTLLPSPKEASKIAHASMQGMIVLIRDITEIRRLQTIANRHDRLEELGEMAALVAHEIRNPLGGIKGFASLLQRDLKDHPDMLKLATCIVEGTDNLNRLVTNVLNYARPAQPKFESVDLTALMQQLKEHLQADATFNPKIQIQVKSSHKSMLAPVDPDLFKLALLNLMVNALQAMPEGGTLTLTLSANAQEAQLIVADTGTGISAEHQKKLFTPFFTTKPAGNGFGLVEVMKIVQAHGGTIDVASIVGKGTAFTIKIPIKRISHGN